jgi:hypothetical protein
MCFVVATPLVHALSRTWRLIAHPDGRSRALHVLDEVCSEPTGSTLGVLPDGRVFGIMRAAQELPLPRMNGP